MTKKLTIRPERTDDHAAISGIIRSAFVGIPYAAGHEADLVEVLRAAHALTVSLVAELQGVVIGQIAFSPQPAAPPGNVVSAGAGTYRRQRTRQH